MSGQKKILYVASTVSHLNRFHQPYIRYLSSFAEVRTMANGEGADYPIGFSKSMMSRENFAAIKQIRKILKEEKFDGIVLNTTLAAFLVREALRGVNPRPYVLNIVHGYLFPEMGGGLKGLFLLFCERRQTARTDLTAVMNREDFRIACLRGLSKNEPLLIDGMGIPFPEKLPEKDMDLRAQFAAEDEILMTYVGELSNRKNQSFLIDAVAKLRAEGLPVKLLLLGEGSRRADLEKQIEKNGLKRIVILAGNREPVLPYLAVTDLYVSASRSEGLPFNLAEAMAFGLPIVAGDVKGQNDLLEEDAPEALYPEGDLTAFCNAVKLRIEKGNLGANACSYPHLSGFALSTVLETNCAVLFGEMLKHE